ncbi:MAG TPA: serine protease [Bryobacteraceae bacterium]
MVQTRWASIGRIEVDGKHSGTGFLVAGNYLLTALHVVADKDTGQPYPDIRVYFDQNSEFQDGSKMVETDASIARGLWSIQHDFALLECTNIPDRATPLRLSDRCLPFDNCSAPGFAIQKPSGFTVSGHVSSLNEPMPRKTTALGVQFHFGSGVRMRGHSGAPLLVRERAVGLLRTAFEDDVKVSAGGIVHATSIRDVVASCNVVASGLLSCRAVVQWPSLGPTESRLLLADRKAEFELFQRMITGKSTERILLLEGESGFGKSTLMDELMNYAQPLGVAVGRADCKGGASLSDVFDSLLFSLPQALFPQTRETAGNQRFFVMADEIADLERPVVLQIDTWEDAGDPIRQWVTKTLFPAVPANPGLVVVIAGNSKVEPLTKACPAGLCARHPLKPILSTDDWHDYAVRRWPNTGLTTDHITALVLRNRGIPINVETDLAFVQGVLAGRVS